MKLIVAAIVVFWSVHSAIAQDTSNWSPEFARGWCVGYVIAQKSSMRNRDHYRRMSRYPAETHAESMKRIRDNKWPPPPPAGYRLDTVVQELVNLEMAGIDLYVVLPPVEGMFSLNVKIQGGILFSCPTDAADLLKDAP